MGDVVDLNAVRASKKELSEVDKQIIDSLLGGCTNEQASDACGFMNMRFYQLGVKTTDVNATLDMDVILFLAKGVLERVKGQETENTLLLDTLRLHFGYQDEASQASVTE